MTWRQTEVRPRISALRPERQNQDLNLGLSDSKAHALPPNHTGRARRLGSGRWGRGAQGALLQVGKNRGGWYPSADLDLCSLQVFLLQSAEIIWRNDQHSRVPSQNHRAAERQMEPGEQGPVGSPTMWISLWRQQGTPHWPGITEPRLRELKGT